VEKTEIAVVGGGAAGLAVAALLRQRGFNPLVLEAGPEPGAVWRTRYDRLRLHTPRLLSGLPGMRIPRSFGRWVARDDLIEYFRRYVERHDLDVRTNTRVERIEPSWRLETSNGPIEADAVIVATGYNGAPLVPDWPGRDGFTGELIHSSQYMNPEPYRGRDVLVVGSGNSGAEIAHDLIDGGAAR
jgi:putative flavoprotein involved in K+ transport